MGLTLGFKGDYPNRGKKNNDLLQQYHQTRAAAKKARAYMVEAEKALKRFRASVNGERELFDEFVVRAGKQPLQAQIILKKMIERLNIDTKDY